MRYLLIFLAACGLGPGPDTAGPAGSAGNAPWTDVGAVRVCLDITALGPGSTQPEGLCLRGDAPEPFSCEADADCRSREACVCGRCTVPYCDSNADCDAPRSCNFAQHRCDLACTDSPQCGDAENCINGVCRGRCATTEDCQHGEFCDFQHVCSSDDCTSAADCQGTERCELQRLPRTMTEPSPLPGFALYLDIVEPQTGDHQIWHAASADGQHFTMAPDQPILDGRAPSALRDGGTTYLYVELNDGIAVATSTDGVAFGAPSMILAGTDFHAPSAVHVAGGVVLYYERGGAIGVATGPIGAPLDDGGIVLAPADVQVGDGTPGTAFWLDVTELASPHAILGGPDHAIHLWFSGLGVESTPATKFGQPVPIPANYSIGFAAAPAETPTALSVWPYGPVFDRVDAFLEHRDDLAPGIVDAGDDRYFLYEVDATRDAAGVFQPGRIEVLRE